MDLGDLRISGRVPTPPTIAVVRELSEADLPLLSLDRGAVARPLTRIRDNHHALAKIISTGVSRHEASLLTGLSASRISILAADPAFQELVAFYRANETLAMADLGARMASISMAAQAEIAERLEEDPDSFSNGELRKLLEMMADRTGYGPRSTNVNVNIDLADKLNAARRRLQTEAQCVTVDLPATLISSEPRPSSAVGAVDGEEEALLDDDE